MPERPYTATELRALFASPYTHDRWRDALRRLFPNKLSILRDPKPRFAVDDDVCYELGHAVMDDSMKIGFYYFSINSGSVAHKRVGLRQMAKSFVNPEMGDVDMALVVYDTGDEWRLSLICDIKGQQTAPRRFTYLFGPKHDNGFRTPVERFRTLMGTSPTANTLLEAFSVEALSKEFYTRLFDWYSWALSEEAGAYFPNAVDTDADDRENMNIKFIRLITRLLFVWFIKQKGLVPESLFHADELRNILKDFHPGSAKVGSYYNAILQNLFFATLNCPVEGENGVRRHFSHAARRDVRNLYRYADMFSISEDEVIKIFSHVPFLNGGLFECLDKFRSQEIGDRQKDIYYDGFSRSEKRNQPSGHYCYRAFVPDMLFFSGDDNRPGLIELLQQYNFTIEENAADDAVISLDPELLGRVFENLLADYNPETRQSARNATGSFYTPRQVVDFMVDESLASYLLTDDTHSVEREDLRTLMHDHTVPETWDAELRHHLALRLTNVKILDPACGSGAFPMGALLRITELVRLLDPEHFPDPYALKLQIIQNCIYGVDIQSIAMMICKLRFFISLIVDQKEPNDDPRDNYGIQSMPNLETKFVAADTLLSSPVRKYEKDVFADPELRRLQDELHEIRLKHFLARTPSQKKSLRERDRKKCQEIQQRIKASLTEPDHELIERLEAEICANRADAALPVVMKEEKVPVGAPSLFDETPTRYKTVRRDINASRRQKARKAIEKCQADIEAENNKSIPKGHEAALCDLTNWDPYDQNSSAPYFDPSWMFGFQDQHPFNIVLGNPPYIQLQDNQGALASRYEKAGYQTFARTGDIYCLFYERAAQLLAPDGNLTFITSNKWMRAAYGQKLRGFLAGQTDPTALLDFGGVQVFESATVDTNILQYVNRPNRGLTQCAVVKRRDKDVLTDLDHFMAGHATSTAFVTDEAWVVLSDIEKSIKAKIDAVGTPLKNWNIQIYRGILTGCNEAFIIDEAKRNEILAACATPEERQRTEALIRPILRGRDIKRYGYTWAGLYLINTHNGVKGVIPRIKIEDYPAVKAHLDKYWSKISRRADRGDTPYNLRNCAYVQDFSQPKVIYMEIQSDNQRSDYTFPRFSYDTNNVFVANTGYILTSKSIDVRFILGVLNSKVGKALVKMFVTQIGEGYRMLAQYVGNFPIPLVDEKLTKSFTTLVKQILSNETKELASKIDQFVVAMYGFTKVESEYLLGQS